MKLDIPDEDRAALEEWLIKDVARTEKLLDALERAKPTLDFRSLATQLADLTEIDEELIGDVLRVFRNMSHTIAHLDAEHKDNAAEVIYRSIVGDVTDADQKKEVVGRIERVLASRTVEVTGKAFSVLVDHEQIYCSARTLSEIRPVFVEDGLEPMGAVIVHQLKLVFHTGPDYVRQEIFIAIDHKDLQHLQGVLERALKKHEKLVEMVAKTGVPLL